MRTLFDLAPPDAVKLADGPSATVSIPRGPPHLRKRVARRFEGGVVRIRLNAPPSRKANESPRPLFSLEGAGVPKSRIALVAGEEGRNKIVRVDGITREALLARAQSIAFH